MVSGDFVNIDSLSNEDRGKVLDIAVPTEGLLITEGTESAKIILEAFPKEGYSLGDANELRDIILKFNKEHYISPSAL